MTREEAIRKLQKQKAEYLEKWVDFSGVSEAYDMAIEALKQPKQEWIPVSERLPLSREEVIVSICDETGDTRYNYTSHGWLTTDKEYWIVDNEINNYVVAWMPLPEPWKGEEE